MKIIFGLGNPGQQYKNNRHNIGYMIVDELVRMHCAKLKNSFRLSAHVAKSNMSGQDVMFVKPRTFMNKSGECIRKCLAYHKIDICDILIVYDDVDLKLGDVRFRGKGTFGGHRGMESIISALKSDDIQRLKIGIGKPEFGEVTDHVLSDFSNSETGVLEDVIERTVSASSDWVSQGLEFVMKNYNRRSLD